jgi:hypothetical protein
LLCRQQPIVPVPELPTWPADAPRINIKSFTKSTTGAMRSTALKLACVMR